MLESMTSEAWLFSARRDRRQPYGARRFMVFSHKGPGLRVLGNQMRTAPLEREAQMVTCAINV
jgi:hypothetical protein